jgi:hypothetical protein
MLTKKKEIIYLTDFSKSINKNDYGNKCLINKVDLSKKTRILMPEKESCKLILSEKTTLVKEKDIISGACDNGYNEDILNEDIQNKIEKQISLENIIKNDLSDIGISKPDLVKKIIKTLDNDIDLSFITDLFNRKI